MKKTLFTIGLGEELTMKTVCLLAMLKPMILPPTFKQNKQM
jgi:hypothetical protein